MEKFSVREVLEQAVQTEKLGAHYYSEMARKFEENNDLKKLFITLADKEVEHEKIFEGLKGKVREEHLEGMEEVSHYFRAIMESAFFLGKEKALSSIEKAKTVTDVLNYALGFEKESLLYYLGLRDAVNDKETINRIINEERSHIVQLDYLKKSLA